MDRRLPVPLAILLLPALAWGQLTDDDIRAWYPLTRNAEDISGNGRHGTLLGDGMDPVFLFDAERPGTVAAFDGVDDVIDIRESMGSFTEAAPGGQFAVSFWIRTDGPGDDVTTQNVLMGSGSSGGVIEIVGNGSWQGMGRSRGSAVGVNSGGGGGSVGQPPGAENVDGLLQDGGWHHLHIQWIDPDGTIEGSEASEAEIWIDGVRAEDANDPAFNGNGIAGITELGRGTGSDGGSQDGFRYTGRLSDVIFFERQLTDAEVLEAMALESPLFVDGFED